jgi:hypothetical protein
MNALRPEKQIKVNDTKIPFKMMENIGKFLDACVEYGLSNTDTFATADLYENVNMTQVVNGIFALGRMVSDGYCVRWERGGRARGGGRTRVVVVEDGGGGGVPSQAVYE